jgi:hypothetical protein
MEAGFKEVGQEVLSGAIEPKDGKNDKQTKAKPNFDDPFEI